MADSKQIPGKMKKKAGKPMPPVKRDKPMPATGTRPGKKTPNYD